MKKYTAYLLVIATLFSLQHLHAMDDSRKRPLESERQEQAEKRQRTDDQQAISLQQFQQLLEKTEQNILGFLNGYCASLNSRLSEIDSRLVSLERIVAAIKNNSVATTSLHQSQQYPYQYGYRQAVQCSSQQQPQISAPVQTTTQVVTLSQEEKDRQLFGAAVAGDLERVKELIEQGANKDARDNRASKGTSLHWAAHRGHLSVVKYLVEQGANINARSSGQQGTPLHYAAHGGHLPVVQYLVGQGANTGALDNTGLTPLNLAGQRKKQAVANYLKSVQNPQPQVPQQQPQISAPVQTTTQPVTVSQSEKNNQLFDAIEDGDTGLVQCLIEQDNNNNVVNEIDGIHGYSPLHLAAFCGNCEMVKLLIEKGANVNAQEITVQNTPLHSAILGADDKSKNFKDADDNMIAIKILLQNGANVFQANADRRTPKEYARSLCLGKIVNIIEPHDRVIVLEDDESENDKGSDYQTDRI